MSSSVRIRLNFADPDPTSSWMPLVGGEAGKLQSYFVCRDGNRGLQIDTVDDKSSGYDRPMVLAAIRIVTPLWCILTCSANFSFRNFRS